MIAAMAASYERRFAIMATTSDKASQFTRKSLKFCEIGMLNMQSCTATLHLLHRTIRAYIGRVRAIRLNFWLQGVNHVSD